MIDLMKLYDLNWFTRCIYIVTYDKYTFEGGKLTCNHEVTDKAVREKSTFKKRTMRLFNVNINNVWIAKVINYKPVYDRVNGIKVML